MPDLYIAEHNVGPQQAHSGDKESFVTKPGEKDSWNAQLFRSITSTSAAGIPASHKKAAPLGLTQGIPFVLFIYSI